MNIATTLLFYLLVGGAVAAALHLTMEGGSRGERWFRMLTAPLFWPVYLPALLQRPATAAQPGPGAAGAGQRASAATENDALAAAIEQVEAELDSALASLGGWSDAVLRREEHRFQELRIAWRCQATKIRELDQVLSQLAVVQTEGGPLTTQTNTRLASCQQARQANLARLRLLRDRYHQDLMNTLAFVRELVTMIHLAKFTGAPASRAEELVMQIATSIEGLTEVAQWHEADCSPAA